MSYNACGNIYINPPETSRNTQSQVIYNITVYDTLHKIQKIYKIV